MSSIQKPHWQFSLRYLLAFTAVVGVTCAEVCSGQHWCAALFGSVLNLALPAILAMGALVGRGRHRAFCVGAFFPALFSAFAAYDDIKPLYRHSFLFERNWFLFRSWLNDYVAGHAAQQRSLFATALGYGAIIGLLCLFVFRIFSRHSTASSD
jgi:hypothetical protein